MLFDGLNHAVWWIESRCSIGLQMWEGFCAFSHLLLSAASATALAMLVERWQCVVHVLVVHVLVVQVLVVHVLVVLVSAGDLPATVSGSAISSRLSG
jgi:hypothetical protein